MGNGHIVAAMWCGCGDLQYTVVLGALYLPWCLGSVFTFFPYEEGELLRKFKSKPIPKHFFWQSLENLWKSAFRGGDLKPGLCLHCLQKKAELRCLDWCWEDLSKAIISNPKVPLEPKPNISVLCSERTKWGSSLHLVILPLQRWPSLVEYQHASQLQIGKSEQSLGTCLEFCCSIYHHSKQRQWPQSSWERNKYLNIRKTII